MEHEFNNRVVLVVEFLEADSTPTTLTGVTKISIKSGEGYAKFLGSEKDGKERTIAAYRRSSIKGWYVAEELSD